MLKKMNILNRFNEIKTGKLKQNIFYKFLNSLYKFYLYSSLGRTLLIFLDEIIN